MADSSLSRKFLIEASSREIQACTDVEKLRKLCLNLMLQTEALRDMVSDLLLRA